jgi:putative spermidine/putrescine transport system substrate-binding protein
MHAPMYYAIVAEVADDGEWHDMTEETAEKQRSGRILGSAAAQSVSRRFLLKSSALLGMAAAVNMPFSGSTRAAARSLKISTFGGYFEQGFKTYIYPAFQKATGIAVDSVPQSESTAFLMQLQQAGKAGAVPMDLCCMNQTDLMRGRELGLWQNYDVAKVANLKLLPDRYLGKSKDGVDGIGAMGWYQTLVINKEAMKVPPDSWKILWEPGHRNAWGLTSGGESGLFEIVAGTWFGGNDILSTKAGIDKVLAKIAELKPNVKLWWEEEGTMQTALENDDVIGGQYFNDVAHTMAKNGTPVVSVFPKEGALIDYGAWALLAASKKQAEAIEFVNYTSTPEAQALMARYSGLVPLIDRSKMNLTQAEFDRVSSDVPPLQMAAAARVKYQAYMDQQFTKMLAG